MSGCARALLCCGVALVSVAGEATELRLELSGEGVPLAQAVASLHGPTLVAQPQALAVMDQRGMRFEPGLLVVTVGTEVQFPNSDNVRHNVYSFSPAKRFELPLYAGTPAAPVPFDQAGIVAIGCNIHDWMLAHILVLDSPVYAISDADGRLALEAPRGDYTLRLWHARLPEGSFIERPLHLDEDTQQLAIELDLAPPTPPRRAEDRRRARQERFHQRQQEP